MVKNAKGTVTVDSFRGRLRLRLPRQCYRGQLKYFSLGLPDNPENKKAAIALAKRIEADIAFQQFDPSLNKYKADYEIDHFLGCVTLYELWEKYTHHKSFELEQTTIQTDFRKVGNFIKSLEGKDLNNPKKIRDEIRDKLPPVSARKTFTYLKACCRWAVEEELLPINPFEKMTLKSRAQKPIPAPFSDEERRLIINSFASSRHFSYYLPFVKFLFLTGARTSEAIGLLWKNVAPDFTYIRFSEALVRGIRKGTKTGKSRVFPCNQELQELLRSMPRGGNEESVFKGARTPVVDPHNFLNRAWKEVMGLLDIPYRPQYNTRSTFITKCLESGVGVSQVATWVGNSPKTIWTNYAGLVNLSDVPKFDDDDDTHGD